MSCTTLRSTGRTASSLAAALLVLAPTAAHATTEPCSIDGISGSARLFLYPDGAVVSNPGSEKSGPAYYNGAGWLVDGWIQHGGTASSLVVHNAANYAQGGVTLVIAIPEGTTAAQLSSITLSGGVAGDVAIPYSEFGRLPQNPFLGQGSHGVYPKSGDAIYAFYKVGAIGADSTRPVTVTVQGNGDPTLQVHFDAYDCVTGDVNAFSSDFTWIGPSSSVTIACPADLAVECDAGFGWGDPGAPEVEGATSWDSDLSDPSAPYAYRCGGAVHDVTYWAPESNARAWCTSKLTVQDTTPPTIACAPQTLYLDGACRATPAAATAADSCDSNVTVTCSAAGYDAPGTAILSCTAADCAGNSASCESAITIVDAIAPQVTCPAPVAVECLGASTPATLGEPSASDNCSVAGASCATQAGYPLGTTSVPCTATDGSGNAAAACATSVSVIDTIAPLLFCPPAQTVRTSENLDYACSASLPVVPTAADLCEGLLASYCDKLELSLSAPGTDEAACFAADSTGNTSACATSLALVDDTAPALFCAEPAVVEADEFCRASAFPSASAYDNCDEIAAASCEALEFSALGTQHSTCIAADAAGNESACSATVTMIDAMAPGIAIGAYDGGTQCNDLAFRIPFTWADNCGCTGTPTASAGQVVVTGPGAGYVDLPTGLSGSVTVTISVPDCSGNIATASAAIPFQTCFCTYTQGGYGADCNGNNPGCLRDRNFSAVYPNGMLVGTTSRGLDFTSSAALNAYLPSNGAPAVLAGFYTNPTRSYGGTLGGNTTTLKLSLGLDDAGKLARIASIPLGDLKVSSGAFAGKTVREMLALAEKTLSGQTNASPSAVNAAIDAINNNFDNCSVNRGFLAR